MLVRLCLEAGQFGVKMERLAYFSQHSLGRFYNRSADTSDAALFALNATTTNRPEHADQSVRLEVAHRSVDWRYWHA